MITEATLNPFIQEVKAALFDGLSLAEVEGFTPGGFTRDDVLDIRQHFADRLTPEERVWIKESLEPPHIYDQIQAAAAVAAAKRAEFETADAEQLRLCSAAVAMGRSYTDVAAAAGMSRQVLTKRLERRECRAA